MSTPREDSSSNSLEGSFSTLTVSQASDANISSEGESTIPSPPILHQRPSPRQSPASSQPSQSSQRRPVDPPTLSSSFLDQFITPGQSADEIRRYARERQRARRAEMSLAERTAEQRAYREGRRAIESLDDRAERLEREGQQRAQNRMLGPAQRDDESDESVRLEPVPNISYLIGAACRYQSHLDYAHCPAISIGDLSRICKYCNARCFVGEPPGLCCAAGTVRLESIREPPEPVYTTLFSNRTPVSREFMKAIRSYNNCFNMTSFGATEERVPGWMPTFRIRGQIHHKIGSLLPVAGAQPKFLQVFFMDRETAQVDLRVSTFPDCRRWIIEGIQELLSRENILIRQFKMALENLPDDQHCVAIRADRNPGAGQHRGQFNAPTVDEVAIVMVIGDQNHTRRDIILRKRDNQLKRIDELHPSYDALQYPLIFWRGNDTYHINLKQVVANEDRNAPVQYKTSNVSCMNYYAHQLMIRGGEENFILRCGVLLNQYVVDMYAKIEAERLLFIRLNQAKLRADEYIHLRDAIRTGQDPTDIGSRVILPSTFTGSPRHMAEYTQDAMAYVRLHGRPHLFITFTCNPNWPEITKLLFEGQTPTVRHDIVARVFRQKVIKLMNVLTKLKLFGTHVCYMYTIEWQKRGLPHAHILLWLRDRIMPEDIDKFISAEMPDQFRDPVLFKTITRNMIHGPCGSINPRSPCMDGGRCTKRFPRAFVENTQSDRDGYPTYRRRRPNEGGHTWTIETGRLLGFVVDNSWVVPHSPILCKMFDSHINVEYCHSVKSIKYICKYINKGSDMCRIEERNRNDEITCYQTGRYISTSEAYWRIFSFPIHDREPAVQHLAVHLEDEQRVYFGPTNAAARAAIPPQTTLTAFFTLNQVDITAKNFLYIDIPRNFTWDARAKCWKRRQRGNTIGRVYTVSPREIEKFYLRILLFSVKGPTSFSNIRTYEGVTYGTYRQACIARGLVLEDAQWTSAMTEASTSRHPNQLRILFVMILCNCNPADPKKLFDDFKEAMSEDILHQRQRTNPDLDYCPAIFNQCLILLQSLCLMMDGRTLNALGLPAPDLSSAQQLNIDVARELDYDTNEMQGYVEENFPLLIRDQKVAYLAINRAIESGRGGMFFLDAPGGTGKTFLLNLILANVRQRGEIIIAAASSGIAACLLTGGRTAHSVFKIPLNVQTRNDISLNISLQSSRGKMLAKCKAIIWDECTMAHKNSLEAVDRLLKDLRKNDQIFGGAVMILAGDFRQTLPVIPRSTPADTLNACLKESQLWRQIQVYKLTTNMRVHLRREPGAENFCSTLLTIGDGSYPILRQPDIIQLSTSFCCAALDEQKLIDLVFPNLETNIRNPKWLSERAILAPLNEMVDTINSTIQDRVSARSRYYHSVDRVVDEEEAVVYSVEFMNSLSPPSLPPHELCLKIGSPIILLRNLNPPRLCNGTRLRVKQLLGNVICATILSGQFEGEEVFIPRIPLIPTDIFFQFKRIQFPVRLAFAMTINKSQGQSIKVVGVNLQRPVFSHGQLYVAFSRVGSPSNLYVLTDNTNGTTRNVVYRQALR